MQSQTQPITIIYISVASVFRTNLMKPIVHKAFKESKGTSIGATIITGLVASLLTNIPMATMTPIDLIISFKPLNVGKCFSDG